MTWRYACVAKDVTSHSSSASTKTADRMKHSAGNQLLTGSTAFGPPTSTCGTMVICHPAVSYWSDATVHADYALSTTTTMEMMTKRWYRWNQQTTWWCRLRGYYVCLLSETPWRIWMKPNTLEIGGARNETSPFVVNRIWSFPGTKKIHYISTH